MRSEKFNEVEHEAIVLLADWEMLGGMVNYAFFNKLKRTNDVLLMFDNSNDKRLFNILLGDFLSQPNERGANDSFLNLKKPPKSGRPTDYTFLFYLRQICAAPKLAKNSDCIQKPVGKPGLHSQRRPCRPAYRGCPTEEVRIRDVL
jgi:hypothetical protein